MSKPQLNLSQSTPLGGTGSSTSGTPNTPSLDMSQSQQLGSSNINPSSNPSGPVHNDELQYGPNDSVGGVVKNVLKTPAMALEGVGEGVFSTLAGAGDLINKGAQYVHDKVVPQQLHDVVQGHRDQIHPIPQAATAKLHELAGDNNTPGSSSWANKTGYGGETLMEFMMGDETLKGLSTADKALAAGKALKVVEKSPKLIQALKIGAKSLAEQSARAGVVQGTQTLVRSGGDVDAAARATVEGAGTSGILGAGLGVAGNLASKLGEAGTTAGELAETAANAPDKQTVAQNIQGRLQNSKTALHEGYESGINDITNRLGDNKIEAQGNPIANKAKELLAKPNPEDHAFVQQAKEATGDHLDPKTKGLLQSLADGTQPLTEDEIEEAKQASKPSGLLDASGKPLKAETVEPEPKPAEPLSGHDLIQLRQQVRKLADGYEPGDVNARALRTLLWDNTTKSSAFDDTMDQIASKSSDPTAVGDYQALRNNYRSKINIYDDPVIKNLMEGKPDDAAKAFIGTKSASGLPTAGKTEFNVQNLKTVLGDDGFNHFRNQVFDNVLKTASDSNGFNPAKFVATWGKIADGTKSDLFGAGDPAVLPQNYVTAVTQDAKAASNMQKLTRAGLIAGPGAVATMMHPAVGGVSTVLAFIAGHEGAGGIAKGRDFLDYVANHPKTWATFRGIGRAAQSPTAAKVAQGIKTAGQAAVTLGNNTGNEQSPQSQVYQSIAPSLGGATQGSKVVEPADNRGAQEVTLPTVTPSQ